MSRIKPILFNTEMVKAILDGSKTVTRRILKVKFKDDEEFDFSLCRYINPPYEPGDILYVRETWAEFPLQHYHYRADFESGRDKLYQETVTDTKWKPSIHMPKEAARIFLRVTDVRVERLKDMTLDDFLAEGVELRPEVFNDPENAYMQGKKLFIQIWDSTIKKEELEQYGWNANTWVWVIEFARKEEEDNDR
ncbi:MAG: hypothetical protein K2M46_10555 [Lachnospiraceae bacterium]|nr:hypothetical protein [Lachnospiraceae bacterium]